MLGISFIKILFPIFLIENCIEPQGSDCYNNGWSIPNKVVNCAGKLYLGPFGQRTTISKEFYCPPGTYLKLSFTSGIFDSWDREYLYVEVDDEIIDKSKCFCFDGKYICRNTIWQYQLVEKTITIVSKLGKNKIKISIYDNLDNPLDDGNNNGELEIQGQRLDIHVLIFLVSAIFKVINGICSGNNTTPTRQIPFQIKSILIIILIMSGIVVKLRDPKYMGGETQTYTSNQTCMLDYNFPRYQKQN
ncbi:unnamed protein product [Paramecium sonneborni]|uniref:Uncharacterized protein n=1 Tax=Paramecium sonneborni TaxID=65129 RepID=A0A8S1RP93_9CILI|nr:unnamed protein product [Paramecium sonneborni]